MLPPLTAVAVNVTDVPAQTGPEGDDEIFTDGDTTVLTTMVTGAETTDEGVAQTAFERSSTVITSPFTKVADENKGEFVPVFTPFTFHWYTGELPPFTGVAVKLTGVPGQTAPAGETVTDT